MATSQNLPFELYRTNLELQQRINKLLQDSGQQWLDAGTRLVGDGMTDSRKEVEQLLAKQDWQALAALPVNTFWRQLQQRQGDAQTVAKLAVDAQTAFSEGLQQAIHAWQTDVASIVADAGKYATTTPTDAWQTLADAMERWGQPFSASGAAASARKGSKK